MMKKIILMSAAFTLIVVAHAQDPAKFGLKGGLNLSRLDFNNSNSDFRTGFHFGGLAHIHLTPSFSLQPELYFSTQGGEYEMGNNDTEEKLSYINIPVLLQYNFANGFRLQAGPQLGILVDSEVEVNGVEVNTSSNNYNNVDFSIPLGLSYLGYSGFGVDARFNLGISNVYENNNVKAKNQVIQLGVFYLFDHRHKAKSR
jgi:hypothetical protein